MNEFQLAAAPTTLELPHSSKAEEGLLSCILLDGVEPLNRATTAGITYGSFYDHRHAVIFGCCSNLATTGQTVDVSVVCAELTRTHKLEAAGGLAYLAEVSKQMPTTAHASYFIKSVSENHQLRRLHECAQRIIEHVAQPDALAADVVVELRASLDRLADSGASLGQGVTAVELCAAPPPVPPELISGALYRGGTMMLSGPSKSRKTYTFLDLGISVATGSEWLGFATAKCGVLYLNFELSEHSFQRRLAAICAAKGTPPPPNFRSFNLRGKTCSMAMLAVELPRLIQTHGAGLVILDPWYKISAQSGADENNNTDQGRILAEAERIVTANGAALVLGHHFAKGDASAKNSIDRAAGAGAMARWGDVIATLSEHEEQEAMTLELHLRDFAPVAPIALRWEQPLWRRDDNLDPAKLKTAGRGDNHPAAELLGMLKDGMTNKEWFEASRWSDGTYRRKRDMLTKSKKVICEMGTYRRA
jgi:RecA-family ATPase